MRGALRIMLAKRHETVHSRLVCPRASTLSTAVVDHMMHLAR